MRRWLWTMAIVFLLGVFAGAVFYFNPLWVNDQGIRLHLWRADVHSDYTMVDGYRIHYFEASPPQPRGLEYVPEKPLVLVHGLGARGEDWSALIPGLAAHGFHVYALDLPGYGRSSKPDVEYSIAFEEKSVADFMQALRLSKADVGGWSMGGWIAMKLAEDHPELVDRLVVYDSAGLYFPATFDETLFTPADGAGLYRLQAMLSPDPKPLPGFVANDAIQKLQANARVIRSSVVSMKNGRDLLDFHLQHIHQPTLIVWGKQDRLIPLAVGKTLHRDIQGSSLLVVDGCGHLAPAECWGPVLTGTLKFLTAEPALRGGESTVAGR